MAGPSAACNGGGSSKSQSPREVSRLSVELVWVGRPGKGSEGGPSGGTAMVSGGVADPSSIFKASRKTAREKQAGRAYGKGRQCGGFAALAWFKNATY